MHKIHKLIVVVLISCLSLPAFASGITSQLIQYVDGSLLNKTTNTAEINDGGYGPNPSEQLNAKNQQTLQDLLQNSNPPGKTRETEADLNEYINQVGEFSATGQLSPWQKRRNELYQYVKESNWRTWKNISDADRAFLETVKTMAFGLIKEAAGLLGWDLLLDRIEQKAMNELENNDQVQYAVQAVSMDIIEAMTSEEHAVDRLYVKVQRNAFNLLLLNEVDYKKLSTTFPEVEFLFEDLYTFFKWRHDLRNYDASFKLNENNINVEFRQATYQNSFFGWWELANIAKMQIRDAAQAGQAYPATQDVSNERDNIEIYQAFAKRARYFGRVWNGMQRFAVKNEFLLKRLNPKRGAEKLKIKLAIKQDFNNLTKEEVLDVLNNVRTHYVQTRQGTETAWKEWLDEHQTADEQALQQKLKKELQQQLVQQ